MNLIINPAFAADNTAANTSSATVTESGIVASPTDLSPEKVMRDNFIILGVLFFIFYFVLIRPQQKRVKQHQEMVKALKKGDKVITNGGIIGSIVKFEGDEVVVVEISPNVRVRMAKSAISEVTSDKIAGGEGANDN